MGCHCLLQETLLLFSKLINFWLHWVFLVACGLSVVVVNGDNSPVLTHGLLDVVGFLVEEHGLRDTPATGGWHTDSVLCYLVLQHRPSSCRAWLSFQQHKRRLYTGTSPDGQHQNQTDYILSSQRWRSSIQSAKTRLGADCGSDHELLIAKFRLKWKKVGKTTRPFRYDLNQIPYNYTVEVTNRFKGLDLIECLKNYGLG